MPTTTTVAVRTPLSPHESATAALSAALAQVVWLTLPTPLPRPCALPKYVAALFPPHLYRLLSLVLLCFALHLALASAHSGGTAPYFFRLFSELGGYGTNTTPRSVTPKAITMVLLLDRRAQLLFGSHQTLSSAIFS